MKEEGEKIVCLTAYDSSFARIQEAEGVEVILVGDSLGMVIQGHGSTLPVTIEDMVYHARCVSRVTRTAMVMADMPFMSYRNSDQALLNAARLMQEGGACAVKLEGGAEICDTVSHLSRWGIPVCGHLGLQPQSVNKIGGYRIQGRTESQARQLIEHARMLEDAGADMLVLECIPATLARQITQDVRIPVIGIGAGVDCDGQVLVMHDLLGMNPHPPRFVQNFMIEADSISSAIHAYIHAVKQQTFPGAEQQFD
ncbi:MAG: 3-methyl-2-oxobutanoate hydroxymethyltransferase [Gammaproteobacteria bacterium]|nr:MAG: 3-methyl-2-oxobutanoate hydroxymethyltransferase [Gammaproteobacteria bacterium]